MILRKLESQILGSLWGSIVGDALGVPVEFSSRENLQTDPVTDMRGYGAHSQPPGTWSDDSSLILCTVESLLNSNCLNTRNMASRFSRWLLEAHWTPHGHVFDIGIATRQALARFCAGKPPERCGGREEFDNGNGSLMRILPVSLWFLTAHLSDTLEGVHRVSCITHAHPRSQIACGLFTIFIRNLYAGKSPLDSLAATWQQGLAYYPKNEEFEGEWHHYSRLDPAILPNLEIQEIQSSGYCVHTLETSVWSLLRTQNFEDAVLNAINLGGDTDTSGCVTGALAGMTYGYEAIPAQWLEVLARYGEIKELFQTFTSRLRK